ncbi:MAG: MBL fold metallo-hydrolase [Proteobacteria bacterium]|nr:MBL fold metallo-hydrolase [Pseudomonadota bacterium]
MKATILVDNNTIIDRYFLGEPGLSVLIEQDGLRVLLDCGYSGVFIENARRMNLDLLHLDWVVLSHGHLDHTWGLADLIRLYTEAGINGVAHRRPRLLAHPQALVTRIAGKIPEIGAIIGQDKLSRHFELAPSREPQWLSERLVWLGEVPRRFDFERTEATERRLVGEDGLSAPDDLVDDSALACVTDRGLVIVTGCSHSGVCNIVEHAREVTGQERVADVLGGFHLLNAPASRLKATADYLEALDLDGLHACHCTDLSARVALARSCPLRETGSGTVLDYPTGQ